MNILNEGEVGDLIDYAPENQEGLVHYEIIEQNGVKELKKIGDYFVFVLRWSFFK